MYTWFLLQDPADNTRLNQVANLPQQVIAKEDSEGDEHHLHLSQVPPAVVRFVSRTVMTSFKIRFKYPEVIAAQGHNLKC